MFQIYSSSRDELASHPEGSRNTPSRFTLQKPEIIAGLVGHLVRMQASQADIVEVKGNSLSTL